MSETSGNRPEKHPTEHDLPHWVPIFVGLIILSVGIWSLYWYYDSLSKKISYSDGFVGDVTIQGIVTKTDYSKFEIDGAGYITLKSSDGNKYKIQVEPESFAICKPTDYYPENLEIGEEIIVHGELNSGTDIINHCYKETYYLIRSAPESNLEYISDWKTYQNEKFGFELRYPEKWVIDDSFGRIYSPDYQHAHGVGIEGGALISIDTTRTANNFLNELKSRKKNLDEFCEKIETTSIDGANAIKTTSHYSFGPITCEKVAYPTEINVEIWMPHNNVIQITLINVERDKYLKLFDKILSTFRFIKSDS